MKATTKKAPRDDRGAALSAIMQSNNLSAADVAEMLADCGVTVQMVYRWRSPSLDRPIPAAKLALLRVRVGSRAR